MSFEVKIYIGLKDKLGNRYHRASYIPILNKHFKSYSIIEGLGYWEGKQEPCSIVTIVEMKSLGKIRLKHLAAIQDLKAALMQEAILLTVTELRDAMLV